MIINNFHPFIFRHSRVGAEACPQSKDYVAGFATMKEAWDNCTNKDWMLWLLYYTYIPVELLDKLRVALLTKILEPYHHSEAVTAEITHELDTMAIAHSCGWVTPYNHSATCVVDIYARHVARLNDDSTVCAIIRAALPQMFAGPMSGTCDDIVVKAGPDGELLPVDVPYPIAYHAMIEDMKCVRAESNPDFSALESVPRVYLYLAERVRRLVAQDIPVYMRRGDAPETTRLSLQQLIESTTWGMYSQKWSFSLEPA